MDFSTSIHGDLVAGPDRQTWVIVGAKVHEALACGRIGLLVQRAWDRELVADAWLQGVVVQKWRGVHVDCGCFSTRRDVGTGRRGDAMFDVGACE